MSSNVEGTLSIIAALLVLFSAMIDPRISAGLAVVILAMYGGYKFIHKS